MNKQFQKEKERLSLQTFLDSQKTKAERNRLGQFATPSTLASDIIKFGVDLLGENQAIRFFDPAFGTGSFFSALIREIPKDLITTAKGFELDNHYGEPACHLWSNTMLDLQIVDFTKVDAPREETNQFNLLICNPPYVRHHHMENEDKIRLQHLVENICGIHISGLAGLYCYFLCLSHHWMQAGGVSGWLIPSEFMDVNYGKAIKRYLLNNVTLLHIHRFNPEDVQFDDALVSSAIVWFRKSPPPTEHEVVFTFGGLLSNPKVTKKVNVAELRKEDKWSRFPVSQVRQSNIRYRLSDLFNITRGIATGNNKFFILNRKEIDSRSLPFELFRPILPSPRFITVDEIKSDEEGVPILDHKLFLLNCRLPESIVKERLPHLWDYLLKGKGTVSERYLCRSRKVWYFQEERLPAPILCTYLGRSDTKNGRPFRFILNHSQAIAANVYLLLYPKPILLREISREPSLLRHIWELLNSLSPTSMLGEGRVYGGGLHKLEPKELGNVDATPIFNVLPEILRPLKPIQSNLFEGSTSY